MSLTLHFLRHGQTAGSRDQLFCGGAYDIELTEEGQAMAQAFAAHYRSFAWRAIYCSTLKRAIATAKPMCEAQGVAPQSREALREIGYGVWDGHTIGEVDAAHHDAHVRWLADPAWNAPTGGETAIAVATRVLGFVDEVRQAHPDGHVLAVAHKATIRIALCALLGIDVGRFRYRFDCPVASVSSVEFGKHGPLLRRLGDCEHLSRAQRQLAGT